MSLYVANLIVSSRTLLNSIPYLRISMNKLGSDWLPYCVLLRWSQLGYTKSIPTNNLTNSSYQRTQPLVKFLNNTCLRSDFSTQPLSKLKNFYFCRKRCTTTINPYFLLMILQSLQFILFCVRKMILYQIVVRIWKKTVSFDDVVHFIDEENMVTYVDFDCGIKFFPETPTKSRQIKRERNYISRSCEELQCIPSNDQHTCFVDEQHSSNIFLNP